MAPSTVGPKGDKGSRGPTGLTGKWKVSLAISALALITSVGGNVTLARVVQDNSAKAKQGIAFDCAIVHDLRGREADSRRAVRSTKKFIRENPSGIPGISAALLQESLKNEQGTLADQTATLDALSRVLTCG